MEDLIEIKLNFKEKLICLFGFIVSLIALMYRKIKYKKYFK